MPPNRIDPFPKEWNDETMDNTPTKHFSAPIATVNTALLPIGIELMSSWMNDCDELIFMLDISGSMRVKTPFSPEATKFNTMKNMVFHFMNTLKTNVQLGLITVGGSCESEPSLKIGTSASRRTLSNALQTIEADGYTAISRSLRYAPELFEGDSKKKAILFITDGTDSCLPDETCNLSIWLGTQNIALHVLAFSEKKTLLLNIKPTTV
ncbi:MAG: VWA domain-containing protein [Saprospiraceae bacterium]|nr:VWA domain-containing protein [Saprospiraceae bacterium]